MNRKSCQWLLLASLLASGHPAGAQLTKLGIASAGNQSVLFWPSNLANYVLLSTTNLANPNWAPVSNAVPVVAVTVPNTPPGSFFILVQNTTSDGMAYIPAGTFTVGNTTTDTDVTNAAPVSVTLSGFYKDTNLV